MTTTLTPKSVSRVANIFLRGSVERTLYLEVVTEFTDKEIIETVYDIPSSYRHGQPKKDVSEKILKRWTESKKYTFREVTAAELFQLRLSKVPGVVYKKGGKLFYVQVPGTLHINGRDSLGVHLCGKQCTQVCKGCPRTPSLTVGYQQQTLLKDFPAAVKNSWRLERFDFVHSGIEAFNMDVANDACLIFKCDNFATRKTPNFVGSSVDKKLKLAGAYWEDFNGSRKEMLARIKSSEHKLGGYSKKQSLKQKPVFRLKYWLLLKLFLFI